jgi:hypothetical protein
VTTPPYPLSCWLWRERTRLRRLAPAITHSPARNVATALLGSGTLTDETSRSSREFAVKLRLATLTMTESCVKDSPAGVKLLNGFIETPVITGVDEPENWKTYPLKVPDAADADAM